MKILVTGGLGLIGHNVVYRLMRQGHAVTIVDTLILRQTLWSTCLININLMQ